jgi:hypothetical protein
MRRSARAGVALCWLVALLLQAAPAARADDVGQIAVIADTDGKILPALGLCSNFLYPNGLCSPFGGIAFYATHPDNYDILVFLTNKSLGAMEKAGYPLRADVDGIGLDTTPWSYTHFGSQGRLMHALDLGSVQSLPDDPEGIFVGQIPISGLEIVGHEIGHHFMAYASVDHNDGNGSLDILRGYRESGTITHYSCWFNSDSVMYGGMLTDHGNGTFTDVNGPRKYSQLDQYLMGLRSPAEVDPMYYVVVNSSPYGCADWPQARGVAHDITGVRVDFPIEDVIRALGPRSPATSACHYKVGFVFVHQPATPPSASDLDKVERYRTALESWYAWATDGRGSLDTRLDGCGIGTGGCPGQASAQCLNPLDGGVTGDAGVAPADAAVDGGPPAGDAAPGGADGRTGDAATPGADSGAGAAGESGGCGCRAARGGPAAGALGLALAMLALGRRWARRRVHRRRGLRAGSRSCPPARAR